MKLNKFFSCHYYSIDSVILIYASVKLPPLIKSTQSSMNNVMSSLNNNNPSMNQIS